MLLPGAGIEPAPPVIATPRGPMDADMCKLPAAANTSWAERYGYWQPRR